MNTYILWGGVVVLLLAGVWWVTMSSHDAPGVPEESAVEPEAPSEEEAELVGFAFLQDVIAIAPGTADEAAGERVYQSLSSRARGEVSQDTLSRDIAFFMGIQDVPDQGVSVENLEVHGERSATLVVELNYSGGPALRAINMVVENGEWKVDSVDALDTYPPETGVAPNGAGEPGVVDRGGCYVGGCSSQVCSDDPEVMTTCEFLEEYACYQNATCERQVDGECGWTETDILLQCITDARS